MPRPLRTTPVGVPQHVIQRGNNRQICFKQSQDFACYINFLKKYSNKYHVDIHAWVFMTNHIHLLCTPRATEAISHMMQCVNAQYARYFNRVYARTGSVNSSLCTPHPMFNQLGDNHSNAKAVYKKMIEQQVLQGMSKANVVSIKQAYQQGLAVGSDSFLQEMGNITGTDMSPRKQGRPKKRCQTQ